jgi:hypothetical protein
MMSEIAMLRQFTREAALPARRPQRHFGCGQGAIPSRKCLSGFLFSEWHVYLRVPKGEAYEGVTLPFSASPLCSRLAT